MNVTISESFNPLCTVSALHFARCALHVSRCTPLSDSNELLGSSFDALYEKDNKIRFPVAKVKELEEKRKVEKKKSGRKEDEKKEKKRKNKSKRRK